MLHLPGLAAAIEALTRQAAEADRQRATDVATVLQWLAAAPAPAALRDHVAPLLGTEWAGALPATDTPLADRSTAPLPAPGTTIIGVDGSQILPDRHAPIPYALLQVGGLIFRYNGQAPQPASQSRLYYEENELYDEKTDLPVTPGRWGMRRTLWELEYLAGLAEAERAPSSDRPLLACTDGPLLWAYPERSKEETTAFHAYLAALGRLKEAGALPVGYVERPGGRLLVELLWASRLPADALAAQANQNPLHHLNDRDVMAAFLAPGERSVWLERSSPTNQAQGRRGQTIWCCYVNVGEPGYPIIARVEAPAWAVRQPGAAEAIHAVLAQQAQLLDGYPYVLARAHEIALVTSEDKAALESAISRRLWEQGVQVRPSEKARQKSALGKKTT